jgi:hypothetical protein
LQRMSPPPELWLGFGLKSVPEFAHALRPFYGEVQTPARSGLNVPVRLSPSTRERLRIIELRKDIAHTWWEVYG